MDYVRIDYGVGLLTKKEEKRSRSGHKDWNLMLKFRITNEDILLIFLFIIITIIDTLHIRYYIIKYIMRYALWINQTWLYVNRQHDTLQQYYSSIVRK